MSVVITLDDNNNPTPTQVKAIIATKLADDTIQSLILAARNSANDCIKGLADDLQIQILTWLTAHFIAMMNQGTSGSKALTSKSLGDASESYNIVKVGEGLKGTSYGQMAIFLDPNGCLIKRGKMGVTWEVL